MWTASTVGRTPRSAAGPPAGQCRRQDAPVGLSAPAGAGSPAWTRRSVPRERERGGALLTVLWLSAGLAAIGFSVASTVRTETERVSTAAEGLRASYLASGALERAIQWMAWGPAFLRADGSPLYWRQRQTRMTMNFPTGAATVELIPENAKLNINLANADDLNRVVYAVSGDEAQARQITDGILDWRSPSGAPSAFGQYYFSIRPTFQARHASFQEIEELLLVRGMTPELFYGNYVADSGGRLFARGGLRDCLSVWGSVGPFDANTASPALLAAIGVSPEAVAAIVARRQDQPFASNAELDAVAPRIARMAVLPGNTMWTLRATARLRRPDGGPSDVVRTSAATVKLLDRRQNPYPIRVLRWYDDAWSQDVVPPGVGASAGGNAAAASKFADSTATSPAVIPLGGSAP
jgi:general secretion pathway protein K